MLADEGQFIQEEMAACRIVSVFLFGIVIMVFNAIAEFAFCNEFKSRYNFIAVDHLVYTNEVMNNIIESCNMPLVVSLLLLAGFILFLPVCKKADASMQSSLSFKKRTAVFFLYLLVPLAGYFLMNNKYKNISDNGYNNEPGGNGMYEFGAAFWNNEIDYSHFYATANDTANFKILRRMMQAPNAFFSNDPLSIERKITAASPENKWNVVLISVESLSGDYMAHFGNKSNVTPFLDSLIPRSLFFENFYASGTRTVRGLEALSLAIPPTPGQSIVRRPNNENMFAMGSVLTEKGYDVSYIYGGNSFFTTWVISLVITAIQYLIRKTFLKNLFTTPRPGALIMMARLILHWNNVIKAAKAENCFLPIS